jgi:hypothetical protein
VSVRTSDAVVGCAHWLRAEDAYEHDVALYRKELSYVAFQPLRCDACTAARIKSQRRRRTRTQTQ